MSNSRTQITFALIVHVYYFDLWPEVAERIESFRGFSHELFITTPALNEHEKLLILEQFPKVKFCVTPNLGYDVGPFLEVLNDLDLSRYEFIVKLHTKRHGTAWLNYHYLPDGMWNAMLMSFCASASTVSRTLETFRRDVSLGMLSDWHLIQTQDDGEREDVIASAERIVERIYGQVVRHEFVPGTMFVVRTKCLLPLQGAFAITCFPTIEAVGRNEIHKSGLAHSFERVFGYCISSQGMDIGDWRSGKVNDRFRACRKTTFAVLKWLYGFTKPIAGLLRDVIVCTDSVSTGVLK